MGITEEIMQKYAKDAKDLFSGLSLPPDQLNKFHGMSALLLIEINSRCLVQCASGSLKAVAIKNFRAILFCVTLVATAHATGQWPNLLDFFLKDKDVAGMVSNTKGGMQ